MILSMQTDSTKRFSDKVENYAKYRPGYPKEIIAYLENETGLNSSSVIADIGSGTGIFTELLLKNENKVYAVEPNDEMRNFAERKLNRHKNFISLNGTAENTTMKNSAVNFIISAQAFHWFDMQKAKQEFKRIMKSNGYVVLIWNERRTNSSAFLKAYDDLLLRVSDDYGNINHTRMTNESGDVLEKFFGKENFRLKNFYNEQIFDYEGMLGRTFSCSYIPDKKNPKFSEMMNGLKNIFEKFNNNGKLKFVYDTKVYYGKLQR